MSSLLSQLYGTRVRITTNLSTPMTNEDNGELVDVPVMYEGIVVGFDDDYIVLTTEEASVLRRILILRTQAISIQTITDEDLAMEDPDKPEDSDDMN